MEREILNPNSDLYLSAQAVQSVSAMYGDFLLLQVRTAAEYLYSFTCCSS